MELSLLPNLPTSMLRTDLETKRVGFLHKFKPLEVEFGSLTFDAASDLDSSESSRLVLYGLGPAMNQSQDGWGEHDVQVEGDVQFENFDAPGPLLARRHRSWLKSSLSLDTTPDDIIEMNKNARRSVIETIQAHRYVRMMLSRYQDDLLARWESLQEQNASNADRLGEFYGTSRALKVLPIFALQTVGVVEDDMSAWWIVQSADPTDSRKSCVSKDHFDVRESGANFWKDSVDAFIHNTYHLSQGRTSIVQMCVDNRAKLSSIVCVTKQSQQYEGASTIGDEAMGMSFWHFQSEHKCNLICRDLNLPAFENQ